MSRRVRLFELLRAAVKGSSSISAGETTAVVSGLETEEARRGAAEGTGGTSLDQVEPAMLSCKHCLHMSGLLPPQISHPASSFRSAVNDDTVLALPSHARKRGQAAT